MLVAPEGFGASRHLNSLRVRRLGVKELQLGFRV